MRNTDRNDSVLRFLKRRNKRLGITQGVSAIQRYRDRRQARLDARFDDEEETNGNGKATARGNTRLPYGIAKGEGLDTEGMTPKEVWEMLEGRGYSATEEYDKLKKGGNVRESINKKRSERRYSEERYNKAKEDLEKAKAQLTSYTGYSVLDSMRKDVAKLKEQLTDIANPDTGEIVETKEDADRMVKELRDEANSLASEITKMNDAIDEGNPRKYRELPDEERDRKREEWEKKYGMTRSEMREQRDEKERRLYKLDSYASSMEHVSKRFTRYAEEKAKLEKAEKSSGGALSKEDLEDEVKRLEQAFYSESKKKVRTMVEDVSSAKKYTIADCKAEKTTFKFSGGYGDDYESISAKATIYTAPDGKQFVYPDAHGRIGTSIEQIINAYYNMPQWIRDVGQQQIIIQNRYNPADKYWKKTYKDFEHSYAIGGENTIEVFKPDSSSMRFFTASAMPHEIGHRVDHLIAGNKKEFYSRGEEWKKATAEDMKVSGKKAVSAYGENDPCEDFADSIMFYAQDPEKFKQKFPNRHKIMVEIFGGASSKKG